MSNHPAPLWPLSRSFLHICDFFYTKMSVDQQEGDVQDVLQFYDSKGDGRVRVDQLGTCLRAMGLCPTEAQIGQLSQRWTDPDARLSRAEVIPILNELHKEGTARDRGEAELRAFLENFERDESGFVNAADLRHLLTRCGEPLSGEEYELAVREERDQGKVNIHELVRTLTSI